MRNNGFLNQTGGSRDKEEHVQKNLSAGTVQAQRKTDQGGDRRTRQGDPASRAAGEAALEEWWWSATDGPQGPADVSLEPRVPWLRFQDHRQWSAPARATPGEVRPLQSDPRPGRRVMVRTTTAPCSRGNGRTIPRLTFSLTNAGVAQFQPVIFGLPLSRD